MCELLGMSSNHRTSINLSLSVLAERGENPHLHGDGWGVAFYEGNDVRLIKDAGEAKNSEWVDFIKQQQIHSHDVIAHIRRSTIGEVAFHNTHPFVRELHGRIHTFAHNGTLKIKEHPEYAPKHYMPVGTTDSELAFCVLMDRMYDLWDDQNIPTLKDRLKVVSEFAEMMRGLGLINFLYSDGETLFAHGHRRHDPITDEVSWPGLQYLKLRHGSIEAEGGVSIKGDDQHVVLFASVPLSDGDWIPIKENEILTVTRGEILIH
jgi:glutamine amidotransferase